MTREGQSDDWREGYKRGLSDGMHAARMRSRALAAWAADELRMLPGTFVDAYGALWEAGLRHPGSSVGPDTRGIHSAPRVNTSRTSSGQLATRGLAKPEKKKGGSPEWVRSERMLKEKARVDRKLRKLAREIARILEGKAARVGQGRCSSCGAFAEEGWNYCPADGAKVEVAVG